MTMGHIFGFFPGLLPVYILSFMLIYPVFGQEAPDVSIRLNSTTLGEDATLLCIVRPASSDVGWLFEGKLVNNSDRIKIKVAASKTDTENKESTLTITKTKREDHGNYTCVASYSGRNSTANQFLDLRFPASFVNTTDTKTVYEVNATKNNNGHSVTLECVFDMYYKADQVEWLHPTLGPKLNNVTSINDRRIKSTNTINDASFKDNGVHQCRVFDNVTNTNVTGNITLIVYGDPTVHLDKLIGIGRQKLYMNWTVNPANLKIVNYNLWYGADKSSDFKSYPQKIDLNATSFVLTNLTANTTYTVKLEVHTEYADNSKQPPPTLKGTTLLEDPVFVPNISINGFSATSVTIGWHPPPKEVEKYIHYYLLEARKKDDGTARKAYHSRDSRNLPYMFDNLEPHSTYIFKVKACQDYTRECGEWSEEMEAATLDGIPGKPHNVTINCSSSHMFLTWERPLKPNAEIKGYTMELTGTAEFKDRSGQVKKETWGPLSRFKSNDSVSARFDDLQPNTQYTVRVSAMTRTRRRGEEETVHCRTKPAPPDSPPRPRWRKILDRDQYFFKMYLPKVSERNGPICCYRVHVVKLLPNVDMRNLSPQSELRIIDYEDAHGDKPVLGAYITDIFTNNNFPAESEIVIGDGFSIFNRSDPLLNVRDCDRCLRRPYRPVPDLPKPTTAPTTTEEPAEGLTDDPIDDGESRKRRAVDERNFGSLPTMMDPSKPDDDKNVIKPQDGRLDPQANYTVFVELIPFTIEGNLVDPIYSDYLNQLMPAPSPVVSPPPAALEIALQATCAIAAIVLIIMIIFCVMQTRKTRKLPPHAHLEMSRLPPVFRFLWGPRSRSRGAEEARTPPDMPPIAKEDLPAAYAQRHADSDYGFQKEFELLQLLSECFPDRTTHASEARENQPKNRYPDIKAYDQTRVKLSQIDGIAGSDYINANYVMGYKERKKFICAQGPTDTTVNDFWRMIWEHGLELIVMLTNLEEYSKVKCSKYWPDEIRGSKAFGAINVIHVSEKRYSDYIVRELKITKQPTNADGQPIVENNGIVKRNGDIKQEWSEDSARGSPVSEVSESRTVRQYHFLMWKDFAAPEYPHSILRFIKRVNEAWRDMVGRPVVVHCSAGVGRTGTLVALDCLLDQLAATSHAAIFNTVAELRRQRNFLVQSQKQYVFVYRALVEFAHYGDTELPAARLKAAIDRLRNTPEGAAKCLMEHEFDKLMDPPVWEATKSWCAGAAEEVRARNRCADRLPYDHNRVMLAPLPTREYSTYINASFLEAYDNTEGYIITQDPLPNTIFDFWRMVSEQGVSTIVMLSELGEGKCPRYWEDGTAQYEHISVQYDDSESCPYYTRRQFRLTNNKSGHTTLVRHLQYQGWPTAAGHVPEVTRGLAELADAASAVTPPPTPGEHHPPQLVHCNLGTERSALFVALCILICQLRTERRVDVNAVARKVRAQRAHTIDTFLQYEFLHRAILNYAELHNLLDDS